jgi:hypothetical protein
MAARDPRRQQQLLAVLLVLLAAVVVYRVWARPSTPATPSSNGSPAARTTERGGATSAKAPDVRLRQLDQPRPEPSAGERNLFRFKPKAPPPPPPGARAPMRPATPAPSAPTGPPPPAPIALRFIGIVEATEQSKKIAVLSDGRNVYQGKEGDIIEGRYKILHIGAESIEMSYVDGRGRQTIRLTGS